VERTAQRTASGQDRVTNDPIQPAASEVTWVILAPFGPAQVEEPGQGGRPHQPAGVVVDADRQTLVALLVRDLVDPDRPQPGQRVPGRCPGAPPPRPCRRKQCRRSPSSRTPNSISWPRACRSRTRSRLTLD
jgi:hypothetical protein